MLANNTFPFPLSTFLVFFLVGSSLYFWNLRPDSGTWTYCYYRYFTVHTSKETKSVHIEKHTALELLSKLLILDQIYYYNFADGIHSHTRTRMHAHIFQVIIIVKARLHWRFLLRFQARFRRNFKSSAGKLTDSNRCGIASTLLAGKSQQKSPV